MEINCPCHQLHYNPSLPVQIAADAAPYGVSAVIPHVLPDGSEHPITFAFQTLSACEQKCAQIEKEALSLVLGINKFHQFPVWKAFHLSD